MTLTEFVEKYLGKHVDFDGRYGPQCVDLFRQYNLEVLGHEKTENIVGAKDIVEKYDSLKKEKEYFDLVIDQTAGRPGDIVVWGATATNSYGHVAIVVEANETKIKVFEQNGFKQELGAKLRTCSTKGVIGYLRDKM